MTKKVYITDIFHIRNGFYTKKLDYTDISAGTEKNTITYWFGL